MGSGEAATRVSRRVDVVSPCSCRRSLPGVATYRAALGRWRRRCSRSAWSSRWRGWSSRCCTTRSWVALGLDRRFLGQLVVVLAIVVRDPRRSAVAEVLLSTGAAPRRGVARSAVAVGVLVAVVPCRA